MLRSLHTITIISDYLRNKNKLKSEASNIDDIYNFFIYLQNNKNKFYTLYIYNYLFNFISSDEVAKRKTSARVFEDLLAIMCNAKVADDSIRQNIIYAVPNHFVNAKDIIASNRREKADVIFRNNYSFSVKTLIVSNSEINMGSFEKRVLFDGLNVDNYLGERKSKDGAGLGSKKQFLKLLELLESNSNYKKFKDKFNQMAEFIYSDDLLLAIKNNYKMELYFFNGDEIVDIFKAHSKDKDSFLKIVNRYEGNALRIDRNALIAKCNKQIFLDFSYLKNSVIDLVNQFDYKLHKSYVDYFANQNSKRDILADLENLFKHFDKNF